MCWQNLNITRKRDKILLALICEKNINILLINTCIFSTYCKTGRNTARIKTLVENFAKSINKKNNHFVKLVELRKKATIFKCLT